jgi:hypothetical protein
MVRVAAIDANSVAKALITLTAANNMALVNAGRMLVFQPTVVRGAAAEPPRVPEGSLVMYTTQVMAGAFQGVGVFEGVGGGCSCAGLPHSLLTPRVT